ncbi:cortex morphogenetic protein CmpA [Microaerobacter geothermalis]|nr:cortex morphogenetic protein CmpA [Microaerobacter geothermalis]MCF6093746.1 cortex morphogenetic protein CmpA [Microaerobacter geothermalis]
MPTWLRKQLRRAFIGKDSRQIKILNECWFLYYQKQSRSL